MKQNSANIKLKIAGIAVELMAMVLDKPVKQDVVLPLLRDLDQKTEEIAVGNVRAQGKDISCTKGCSACCYQLIPLSQLEARYLTAIVERLPKIKRQKILGRFRDVYQKIEAAGILNDLMNTDTIQDDIVDFGLKYFQLGIPCPFLENNSCSIYIERPLRCREYLVTNYPANCRTPSRESIQIVPFPVRISETWQCSINLGQNTQSSGCHYHS